MDICNLCNLEIVLLAMTIVFLLGMNKTITFLLILSISETLDSSKDTQHIMPAIKKKYILIEYLAEI